MQFGIFTITVLASIMAALVSASPIPAADSPSAPPWPALLSTRAPSSTVSRDQSPSPSAASVAPKHAIPLTHRIQKSPSHTHSSLATAASVFV
ncbi:hypothetical protein BD779DRAFT_1685467 [Infundibulicybe gibba]|nr:hypothetical protein BD779DRAFT_1685467 [Infundibulicybe gibba]